MSNYSKTTDFASKDALATGNANKIVKGTEIDDEFNAIQTAIATKADTLSPTLTGTPLAPTATSGTNTTQIATTAFVTTADSAVTSAITAAYEAADDAIEARTISAGNGLTGGGDLSSSRTLTLGTPSAINATSTNAVTATSHTHALDISGEFTGSGVQDFTGSSGYQVFPGGLIIQWGEVSITGYATANLTFAKVFPNACIQAVVCAGDSVPVNTGDIGVAVYNLTTTKCTIVSGNAGTDLYRVIAIGY